MSRDHRHHWTRDKGGCAENPGVWKTFHGEFVYRSVCRCGAKRVERRSEIAGNTGRVVIVREPDGSETVTDTRPTPGQWRYV